MEIDDMLYIPRIEYLKLEPFSGSKDGVRYKLFTKTEEYEDNGRTKKKIVGLIVNVYPDEFAFEKTDKDKIKTKEFEFDNAGLEQGLAWIKEEINNAQK